MFITWLGQSCFKIQGKDAALVTDPYSPKTGLKPVQIKADVVTISHDHYDHNHQQGVKGDPYVIDSPGEYEVKEIGIQGIPSWHDAQEGKERGHNIIFTYEFEELRLAHLGDLGTKLDESQLDQINGIDILFIPVGGTFTIDAKTAGEVVAQVEPRITIPMHYQIPKLKISLKSVDSFIKEMGVKRPEPLEKLKITKKELPADESRVVILKP